MSRARASTRAAAATLPEWEAPRIRFGSPHQHVEAVRPRRLCRLERGRELGQNAAESSRLLDVRRGGVVVARDRHPAPGRDGGEPAAVRRRMTRRALDQGQDMPLDRRLVHGGGGAVTFLVCLDVGRLSVSRGVVHQREQAETGLVEKAQEQRGDVRMGELAAQMEAVVDPQHAVPARQGEPVEHRPEILVPHVPAGCGADHQRIEDGRDARPGELGVVGHGRRHRVPLDADARAEVPFQIVGVQLDQARDQEVALEVQRRGQARGAVVDRRRSGRRE